MKGKFKNVLFKNDGNLNQIGEIIIDKRVVGNFFISLTRTYDFIVDFIEKSEDIPI